jgi:uncharacterized membrane protein
MTFQHMITITLYTRAGCTLCDKVITDLDSLQEQVPHQLLLVDIDSDQALKDSFSLQIPVIVTGGYKLVAPFSKDELIVTLRASQDRQRQIEGVQTGKKPQFKSPAEITGSDRISYWISKHYLAIVNLFLCLYVCLPFTAPVFKKIGWDLPAEAIYKTYRLLCHQWAFRSFFLFGEQVFYPHTTAGLDGILSFEQVSGITDENDPGRLAARSFEGDPFIGYKVALCERDTAIWGAMAIFGLIYASARRKFPKLHWLLWLIIGVGPVGLDGFSQLISQFPNNFLQSILPYRESTPLLRILTGSLFGWMTAWFMFPLIEESMHDSRRALATKFSAIRK